ncbi:MAG: hypothetical protein IH810_01285 [Proteobacteria bacterium]|nr:hypothetical protein [Pseudomonadota bacterium]
MKLNQIKNNLLHTGVAIALVTGMASFTLPSAYAGGKITIDDTKWISVGMGFRVNYSAIQQQSAGIKFNGTGKDYSSNFAINNARIYLAGQIHKYVKFFFVTECFNCAFGGGSVAPGFTGLSGFASNSSIGILDAIGQFEFNRYVNFWVGRTLVPTTRAELNGPYYHQTHEGFKTPFYPADHSISFAGNQFGTGGGSAGAFNTGAGLYGRDDGVVFYGDLEVPQPWGNAGTLQYSSMVSGGLRSVDGFGPNQSDSMMWSGRLTYNFLNPEKNPGYYTSGGYYGGAGDILAIAIGISHQKDGAGTFAHTSDFTGLTVDLLFEKVLDNNMGTFTFNAEYKRFWAHYDKIGSIGKTGAVGLGGLTAFASPDCACWFRGQAWQMYGLYLIPHKVGIGRFQPYGRFVSVQPESSTNRTEIEGGVNYVIDGYNARISAFYQHGDLFTKGLNYAPFALGQYR